MLVMAVIVLKYMKCISDRLTDFMGCEHSPISGSIKHSVNSSNDESSEYYNVSKTDVVLEWEKTKLRIIQSYLDT